jgi:tetratricopeptide (TPR) repeat protein
MDRASRFDMLQEMLVKDPTDVFLNYALGMELEKEEKLKEAERQYLKTLEINKDYLPCFYRLGQIAEKISTPDEAIKYYKQGLDLAKKQGDNRTASELTQAIFILEDE